MAETIPRDFIELLLSKVDLVDLINSQLPLQKKSSNNYFVRCPFHNENSASFSVSQPKQFYYCFGCGAHGNAIDFLINYERLTFPEAIESLARVVGMEIPRTLTNQKETSLFVLYDLLTEITTYYYELMRNSARAIDYLKSRGITGVIAQKFNIGYAPHAWSQLLDKFGKSESEKKKLLDVGLIIKKNEGGFYDRFRDRIIFPIRDYKGKYVGFGGRILDQGEPKYLNSPETQLFQKGHELYGLYEALQTNRKLEKVLIVEGYMDVIGLFQFGITYAVATLGTATTPHHLKRLFRYTSEIIFCFDGDNAGKTAAWRALNVIFPLMHDEFHIRFLFLPDGEDPDSLIRKEGKEQFATRIANAISLSDFFFQSMTKESDVTTIEGRARLATQALTHIKQLPVGLFQGIIIDELSKRTRIPLKDLKLQLGSNESLTQKTAPAPKPTKLASPIKQAIALLLQQPQLAQLITEPLPVCDLPGYSFLTKLLDIIQQSPDISTGALLEHWRGEKEEAFIAKLALAIPAIPEEGVQEEFLGTTRQLKLLGYNAQINRLLAKAAQNGLSEREKIELSNWIGKKKTISN